VCVSRDFGHHVRVDTTRTQFAELFEAAAPACRECGARVERVEIFWSGDEHVGWRPRAHMVCLGKHRVPVELLPPLATS